MLRIPAVPEKFEQGDPFRRSRPFASTAVPREGLDLRHSNHSQPVGCLLVMSSEIDSMQRGLLSKSSAL